MREQYNTTEKQPELDLLKISPLFGGFELPESKFFDKHNPPVPFVLPPHIERTALVSSAISQRDPDFGEYEAVRLDDGTRTLVGERLAFRRDTRYTLEVYPSSVRVRRPKTHRPDIARFSRRGKINAFSWRSRRRAGFNSANPSQPCRSQFGLTYHENFPTDGAVCKAHLNTFLTWFRRVYPDHPYFWIFEFQSRGAPHFHLFLTIEPKKPMQSDMAAAWNRITSESVEHKKFHNHDKNFIKWRLDSGYITKYLTKTAQKFVPDGFLNCGRFWGSSRDWVAIPAILHSDEVENSSAVLRVLERFHVAVCRAAAKKMKRKPHKPVWRKNHTGCFSIPRASLILARLN
jgi:hypothetical protein